MGVIQKSNMKCIHFTERSKKYYFSSFLPILGVRLHKLCTFLFQAAFFLLFHGGQGGKGILSSLYLH